MKMSYEKVLRLMIKNTRKNLEELSGLVEIVRLMLNAWNRRWGSRGGVGCETRRESGPFALPALRDTSHIHVGRPWRLIIDIRVDDGLTPYSATPSVLNSRLIFHSHFY